MNTYAIIFSCLLAVAVARPDSRYGAPPAPAYGSSSEEVAIIRDDRVYPSAAGEYSLDFETADGVVISESGYGSGPDGAVETQGRVQYISPEGTPFDLSYVSNAEGGYQPESDALPVAPAFPHPIPQFVLDQIAKAAREDAEGARSAPSGRYAAPEPSNSYSAPGRK